MEQGPGQAHRKLTNVALPGTADAVATALSYLLARRHK